METDHSTMNPIRVLFLTRVHDPLDARAGFVVGWTSEFLRQLAQHKGSLRFVTWEGKSGFFRMSRFFRLIRFLLLIALNLRHSDVIFAHQQPLYAILASLLARPFRKKVFLWYVHKNVDFKLKIAVAFSNGIITASRESFRYRTKKPIHIVGHGIDTDMFHMNNLTHTTPEKFIILFSGRISRVKGCEVLLTAAAKLIARASQFGNFEIRIVGDTATKRDASYFLYIKKLVETLHLTQTVVFIGSRPYYAMPNEYYQADVCINLSETGSLDKAVLEAMACGVPVITSNEAFRPILHAIDPRLSISRGADELAAALAYVRQLTPERRSTLSQALRNIVIRDHALPTFISRVIYIFLQSYAFHSDDIDK